MISEILHDTHTSNACSSDKYVGVEDNLGKPEGSVASAYLNPQLYEALVCISREVEDWVRMSRGSLTQEERQEWVGFTHYAANLTRIDASVVESYARYQALTTGVPEEHTLEKLELYVRMATGKGILQPAEDSQRDRTGQLLLGVAADRFVARYQSHKSLREKEEKIGAFKRWCGEHAIVYLDDIDESVIAAYFEYLNTRIVQSGRNRGRVGLSPQSKENHRRVLHAFFEWCRERQQWITQNPVSHIPRLRKKDGLAGGRKLLPSDLKRLYDSFDDSFRGLRDRAICSYLYDAGRRCEIPRIKLDGVDLDAGTITVVTKWNKPRTVRLSNRTRTYLSEYLEKRKEYLHTLEKRHRRRGDTDRLQAVRRTRKAGAVFISEGGKVLGESGVYQAVRRAAREAGLDPELCTPLHFRRAYARAFLSGGGTHDQLRMLMAHEDLATTMIYSGGDVPLDRVLPNDLIPA